MCECSSFRNGLNESELSCWILLFLSSTATFLTWLTTETNVKPTSSTKSQKQFSQEIYLQLKTKSLLIIFQRLWDKVNYISQICLGVFLILTCLPFMSQVLLEKWTTVSKQKRQWQMPPLREHGETPFSPIKSYVYICLRTRFYEITSQTERLLKELIVHKRYSRTDVCVSEESTRCHTLTIISNKTYICHSAVGW